MLRRFALLAPFALLACGAPAPESDASDATPDGHAFDATNDSLTPLDTASDQPEVIDAIDIAHDTSPDGSPDAPAPMLTPMEVTFYGWADNSPPGADIAYPGLHAMAGGTGTYADPITFATDMTEFAPGTILYVPFIEKYVIMEDLCGQCQIDWRSHLFHIDVWMNSDASHTTQLIACENSWTRMMTDVEIRPPPGRPVTTAPLFDPASGTCRTTP
jgi:hypothetical protein